MLQTLVGRFLGRWFLTLALLSAFGLNTTALAQVQTSLPEQQHDIATRPDDIEVFVREGCPHCAKAEEFMQTLKREQPALNIIIHDVSKEAEASERLQL